MNTETAVKSPVQSITLVSTPKASRRQAAYDPEVVAWCYVLGRDGRPRYVGSTEQTPAERLAGHYSHATQDRESRLLRYMRKAKGRLTVMKAFPCISIEVAKLIEKAVIEDLTKQGFRLLNVNKDGQAGCPKGKRGSNGPRAIVDENGRHYESIADFCRAHDRTSMTVHDALRTGHRCAGLRIWDAIEAPKAAA